MWPVSLDTAVSRIGWGGSGVTVETNRGTIEAKAVIVTVSTGVLGAGHITFDPVLPVEKQESFDAISMGFYNHITLQFSEDVFGTGPDGYLMFQVGDDMRAFGGLTNISGSGISYCDVGGSFAQELERAGDTAAVDFAMGKLKEMLGSDIEKAFMKSHVTTWGPGPALFSAPMPRPSQGRTRCAPSCASRLVTASSSPEKPAARQSGPLSMARTRRASMWRVRWPARSPDDQRRLVP